MNLVIDASSLPAAIEDNDSIIVEVIALEDNSVIPHLDGRLRCWPIT